MDQKAEIKVKSAEISAIVIRADGTVEDLGVISEMDDPTILAKLTALVKERIRGNSSD